MGTESLGEKALNEGIFQSFSDESLTLCLGNSGVLLFTQGLEEAVLPSVFATQTLVVENGSSVLLCTRTVDAQHMHTWICCGGQHQVSFSIGFHFI